MCRRGYPHLALRDRVPTFQTIPSLLTFQLTINMSRASLNVDYVRSHFPGLENRWAFMDNAGGSQTLQLVVDQISNYLIHTNVQHGASYQPSVDARDEVALAHDAMTTLINASSPSEVVMGPSASAQFRLLATSLVQGWQPGDQVIITNTDHEANVSPWMDLVEHGIEVLVWRCHPETLALELEDLKALLTPRTRLVAVTHVSNILGTINPIRDIADIVHDAGALICVDGVAYAPHRLIDVQALDVDFYVFSCYKVYGPHYAVMYGRREWLLALPRNNHAFIGESELPYKFQPGNVNYELAAGTRGISAYLMGLHSFHYPGSSHLSPREALSGAFDLFAEHEEALAAKLLSYLATKPRVRIIGDPSPDRKRRVPTISFVVEGTPSHEVISPVDQALIGIRYGDFYAKQLIHDLGLVAQKGVVRVSLVHYNTHEEVDRLIAVFEQAGVL
jgi:cysteine desulfurase family protein (TIGR01976 family)